ncbi:MAG: hypothetical protein KDA78_12280, partial [Planctomycetaceae bacterium]|nr:hypothetical protein [Planctomycetaceae bacterium]
MALAITFAFWNAKSGFSNIEQFSTTAFENQINNQMSAVRDIKKSQIEDYFATIKNQILTFSTDESIISAMEQFKTNFANYAEVKDITDEQVVEMRKELGSYYTES